MSEETEKVRTEDVERDGEQDHHHVSAVAYMVIYHDSGPQTARGPRSSMIDFQKSNNRNDGCMMSYRAVDPAGVLNIVKRIMITPLAQVRPTYRGTLLSRQVQCFEAAARRAPKSGTRGHKQKGWRRALREGAVVQERRQGRSRCRPGWMRLWVVEEGLPGMW